MGSIHNKYGLGISISTHGSYPSKNYTDPYGYNLKYSKWMTDSINKSFENRVSLLEENDMVFLSSFLQYLYIEPNISKDLPKYIDHYSDNLKKIDINQSRKEWVTKVNLMAKRLKKRNINVILMSPLPVFTGEVNTYPLYLCHEEWFRPFLNSSCKVYKEDKKFLLERLKPLKYELNQLKKDNTNLYIFDLFDKVCPGETCLTKIGDKVFFTDNNHISYEVSYGASEEFYKFMQENKLIK